MTHRHSLFLWIKNYVYMTHCVHGLLCLWTKMCTARWVHHPMLCFWPDAYTACCVHDTMCPWPAVSMIKSAHCPMCPWSDVSMTWCLHIYAASQMLHVCMYALHWMCVSGGQTLHVHKKCLGLIWHTPKEPRADLVWGRFWCVTWAYMSRGVFSNWTSETKLNALYKS